MNSAIQYKDIYTIGCSNKNELNYKANANKYGAAIDETNTSWISDNSWNGEYSFYPDIPNNTQWTFPLYNETNLYAWWCF